MLLVKQTYAIQFQLLGGIWIVQTFPAIVAGLYTRWFHRWALVIGWAVAMVFGTIAAYRLPAPGEPGTHFGASADIVPVINHTIYIGLTGLVINLVIATLLTLVFRAFKVPGGSDETRPEHFVADPETPAAELVGGDRRGGPDGVGGQRLIKALGTGPGQPGRDRSPAGPACTSKLLAGNLPGMTEGTSARTVHGGTLATDAARAAGVSAMFTLSGGHVFPLYDAAVHASPPMRLVDVRHEQSAVFAAEATARLTRSPGLAVLTAGPGVTNGVSAITTAHFNGSPVVILGGRAPDYRWGSGSLQEFDHPELLRPVTKRAWTEHETAKIGAGVTEAFRLAAAPHRGPVFVDIALEAVFGQATEDLAGTPGAGAPGARTPGAGTPGTGTPGAGRPARMPPAPPIRPRCTG